MRISDWSSDVCSSDLAGTLSPRPAHAISPAMWIVTEWPRPCAGLGSAATRATVPHKRQAQNVVIVAQLSYVEDGSQGFYGRRSEERRVGKEWVSTCRSRGAPLH